MKIRRWIWGMGILLAGWISSSLAQSFETVHLHCFPPFRSPISATGDIDQDGRDELFLSGKTSDCTWEAGLYRYQDKSFIRLESSLIPLYEGRACFLDYDHDGDADLCYSGMDSTQTGRFFLYRNTGSGLIRDESINLAALNLCRLESSDFNLDGWMDLLYAGIDSEGVYIINLWYGMPQKWYSAYSELPALYPGEYLCTDLDRDGLPDILAGGKSKSGTLINQIYFNQNYGQRMAKDSRFTGPELVFTGMESIDIDHDGDQDVVFSGYQSGYQPISGIFLNRPTGTLDPDYRVLEPIQGDLTLSDFDLDGNPDLILSGLNRDLKPETHYISGIQSNPPSLSSRLLSIRGVLIANDFDRDLKPDWLVLGEDSLSHFSAILMINNTSIDNHQPGFTQPLPPPQVQTDRILLDLPAGRDDHTPVLSLRYQIKVGTQAHPDTIISAADCDPRSSMIFSPNQISRHVSIQPGEYQWQARIMDNAGGFSDWSQPVSFSVSDYIQAGFDMIGLSKGRVTTADFNQDGRPDMAINGFNTLQQPYCTVYLNQNGRFSSLQNYTAWSGAGYGTIYPYDLNLDSYPDLWITGSEKNTQTNATGLTRGYLNQNNQWNIMVPSIHTGTDIKNEFPNLIESQVMMTHLDQDPDPELILCGGENLGSNNIPPRFYIYTYRGGTRFDQWSEPGIPGYRYGGFDCGDLNGDGLTDIVINGLTFVGGGSSQLKARCNIYLQGPNHRFPAIDSSIALQGMHVDGVVKLFDLDRDQDLDIVICGGSDDYSQAYTLIYRNDYPDFPLIKQLPGVFAGDIAIGDIDHNTEPDLFITGWRPDSSRAFSCLYRQIDGNYIPYPIPSISRLYWSTACLADYDQDGNPDLAHAGIDTLENPQLIVYRNSFFPAGISFPLPSEPPSLESLISQDTVRFSWQGGLDGRNNTSHGLAYQLTVRDASSRPIYCSDWVTGSTGLLLHGLSDGNYTAEIRSRDNAGRVSSHQRINSFYIDTAPPEITDVIMPDLCGIGSLTVTIYTHDPSGLDSVSYPHLYLHRSDQDTLPFTINTMAQNLIIATVDIPSDLPEGDYNLSIHHLSDRRHNSQSLPIQLGKIRIDTRRPRLHHSYPTSMQVQVSSLTTIRLWFDRKLAVSSLSQEHFSLTDLSSNQSINGEFFLTFQDTLSLLTFAPSERLNFLTPYRIKASAQIADTLGNPLEQDYLIQFTTGSLIKPDSGAILYSADSSLSLYIPPMALNAEEEISIEIQDSDSRLEWPELEFRINPMLAFRQPVTLKRHHPTASAQIPTQPIHFEYYDSLNHQWEKLGGYLNQEELSVPINQTGRFRIMESTDSVPSRAVIPNRIVLNPRVFNPDNPEKPELDISFTLEQSDRIDLKLFNSAGDLIVVLKSGQLLPTGNYTMAWDGRDQNHHRVRDGLYIVVLRTSRQVFKKSIAVLRKN
ncbi:MAG: VCBS repeat-containing protein [Candidatus Delongbacteria bacterium]|nr:VCBS repeat-containing protein [Candidatus Delongbacteria bacterium]